MLLGGEREEGEGEGETREWWGEREREEREGGEASHIYVPCSISLQRKPKNVLFKHFFHTPLWYILFN